LPSAANCGGRSSPNSSAAVWRCAPSVNSTSINEHSFWRKRLRHSAPVSVALVETAATERAQTAVLELHLARGERLQIGAGVDAATLAHGGSGVAERA
jgi:hypothetical protein